MYHQHQQQHQSKKMMKQGSVCMLLWWWWWHWCRRRRHQLVRGCLSLRLRERTRQQSRDDNRPAKSWRVRATLRGLDEDEEEDDEDDSLVDDLGGGLSLAAPPPPSKRQSPNTSAATKTCTSSRQSCARTEQMHRKKPTTTTIGAVTLGRARTHARTLNEIPFSFHDTWRKKPRNWKCPPRRSPSGGERAWQVGNVVTTTDRSI